jgi:type IV pilus assembly protein PilY1
VLDTFPQSTNAKIPGPIISAPAVTIDGGGKVWLFFGTGRYYNQQDKTDTTTEYLFGIKDSVVGTSPPCAQTSATSCWDNNLVDVSNASICITCVSGTNQVTGVTGVTTLSGSSTSMLQGLVASMDGWFLTLPGAGERSLSSPTAIGGVIFLTTFIPSTDVCVAAGNSNLYALYYLTGTASTSPFIGTTQSGGNTNANASISLGTGLASSMAVQTISQGGSGALGSSSPSQGCSGTVMGHIQGSTGAALSLCANTGNIRSRQLAWINQRD